MLEGCWKCLHANLHIWQSKQDNPVISDVIIMEHLYRTSGSGLTPCLWEHSSLQAAAVQSFDNILLFPIEHKVCLPPACLWTTNSCSLLKWLYRHVWLTYSISLAKQVQQSKPSKICISMQIFEVSHDCQIINVFWNAVSKRWVSLDWK